MNSSHEQEFEKLISEVRACVKCYRMQNSQRILGYSAGPLNASLMFIGEAPGRLGADGSGIPFHGDIAGHNFERLLEQVGLNRYDAFVTNAVLCNPKEPNGNNASPNRSEIQQCSGYLRRQIDLLNPKLVVTLGATSLSALNLVSTHSLSLKEHVRTVHPWYGRHLIPIYHPGQRAMMHRSFANQSADYQFVAETLRRVGTPRKKISGNLSVDVHQVVKLILQAKLEVSYFSVHKLFYLVEYAFAQRFGRRLTDAFIIRQKDGPYVTNLHISKIKKAFPDAQTITKRGVLYIRNAVANELTFSGAVAPALASETEEIINDVVSKYGAYDDSRLKTAVYLTRPMRKILLAEKDRSANFFNRPIDMLGGMSSPPDRQP